MTEDELLPDREGQVAEALGELGRHHVRIELLAGRAGLLVEEVYLQGHTGDTGPLHVEGVGGHLQGRGRSRGKTAAGRPCGAGGQVEAAGEKVEAAGEEVEAVGEQVEVG